MDDDGVVALNHLPAQSEFYHAVEPSVAYVGGVGSGKTVVASDLVLTIASRYPYCGQSYGTPGIAICSNTYPQLIDGTMATFFRQCEDVWQIKVIDRIRSEHKVYIPAFDAVIGVYSADDPDKFKSQEFCFIWIDEAQAWDKLGYDKIIGRLRGTARQRYKYPGMPLQVRITANPPHTLDHWLVDGCTKPGYDGSAPPIRLITAATRDNPYLPEAYITMLRSNYDPEVADIELGGKFGEIGKGRIFRQFRRDVHVFSDKRAKEVGLPPLRYDPTLPLGWAHDFNIDPLCSVLFQWRRVNVKGFQRDVMYVLDEIRIPHSVIANAVDEFALNRKDAVTVARRSGIVLYGDASGNQGNRQTGESDWIALRSRLVHHGFSGEARVPEANPSLVDRFAAGNRMLCDANGDIGVVIHERCQFLRIDLERMFYKPGTRLVDVPKVKDGVPSRMVTHLADAWSYAIHYEYPVIDYSSGAPSTAR